MNNEMMGLDTSTPNVSSDTESGEMHTVKVDGEEMQVSVDELRNGYQRKSWRQNAKGCLKERQSSKH